MKNYPLSIQIWSVIAVISLIITLLIATILPTTLRDFFTDEIYATIDSAQALVLSEFDGNIYRDFISPDFFGNNSSVLENIRTVKHFIIYDENIISNSPIPNGFVHRVTSDFRNQSTISEQYVGQIGNEKVFYTITKDSLMANEIVLVSYMMDSYREDLVQTLFRKLVSIMGTILLFSWIPAIFLSRHLTRPLINLEAKVKDLTVRKWDEPIDLDRGDEIGRLGDSVETLRKQLIKQDESEQTFLQHISHELKTPIMVIRSFTNAIKDGIYPKGDLNNSLDTIEAESLRLEKRVQDILYLTKLDYISDLTDEKGPIDLKDVILKIVDRLRYVRTDLSWEIDLKPSIILGDLDQMRILFENILDNQIKYASTKVFIRSSDGNLIIGNDGPPIEEAIVDEIFSTFVKGKNGQFGIGLAIVEKIINLNNMKIQATNKEDGVYFTIKIDEVK